MAPGTGTALVDTLMGDSPRLMGRSRSFVRMEMTSIGACMLSWLVEGHDRIRAGGTLETAFLNSFHVAYRGNSWVVRLGGRCDMNWSDWIGQGD